MLQPAIKLAARGFPAHPYLGEHCLPLPLALLLLLLPVPLLPSTADVMAVPLRLLQWPL